MRKLVLVGAAVALLVPAASVQAKPDSSAVATPPVKSASGAFSWAAHPVADKSEFAEPSVDVDHGNRVYVTAPGNGVELWRSFDQGVSFDHTSITSPNGGGDSEIEFLADDTGLTADLEVTDSAVSRSTDHFETWTQQPVGIEQDRQWLGHKGKDTVYLAYHDFVLEAEMINRSDDGGKTWSSTPVFISPKGSAPGNQDVQNDLNQGVNTFSGPVVVDQHTNDVYVVFSISTAQGNLTTGVPPFGQSSQVIVGVSHDGAKTFNLTPVFLGPAGTLAGLIFPWVTLDAAGNVYVSYAGKPTPDAPLDVWLATSTDHGDHFGKPLKVNAPDGGAHLYTTVSAGDPGVVDVAWYTGTKPDPADTTNTWYADFAQVRGANTASPTISQSRILPTPIHKGDICLNGILCILGGDRSLLDFFQVQVGPDGVANVAFANNASPDDNLRVWYARQTAGPLAGSGLHDVDAAGAVAPTPAPASGGTLPATGGTGAGVALAVLVGAAGLTWLRRRRIPT